jgi:anti-sigma regulatory factor (Ser/Thr protein kinase)
MFSDFGISAHLSGTRLYVGELGSARTGREDTHYLAAGTFPCGPATPSRARSWLLARIEEALAERASDSDAAVLDATELLEDAALIASELATNAVRAGSGRIQLEVAIDERQMRIAVIDDAPGVPTTFEPNARDDHGRGLYIVEAVASQWGVRLVGDSKEVWAALPLAQGTGAEPLDHGGRPR